MKKLDLDKVNHLLKVLERKVHLANFCEELLQSGKDAREFMKEVKDILEIDQDASIIADHVEASKKINLKTRSLIDLNSTASKLDERGLLDPHTKKAMEDAEIELAAIVSTKLGVEREKLYLEEDND